MCDLSKGRLPASITICSNTEDETLTLGDDDFESEETNTIMSIRQDLEWSQLDDMKYFTTGGSSKLYTAKYNDINVVIKTISPEFENDETVINEMEIELSILCRLHHANIIKLYGAGRNTKGNRFLVLERLDGGTMAKIFDDQPDNKHGRRTLSLSRSSSKKTLPMKDVINMARGISNALMHCHTCIDGCMVLHRDLKPDNIGFTAEGKLKILDFGLSRIIESSSPLSDEVYEMTGGTGSLRYMAPEVANSNPYNHKADVYSFGILLWELLSCKKPFVNLNIDAFFEEIVNGGARPPIDPKWPKKLVILMERCWSSDFDKRPSFSEIVVTLNSDILDDNGNAATTDGNRRIGRRFSTGLPSGNSIGVKRTTTRRRISMSNYM